MTMTMTMISRSVNSVHKALTCLDGQTVPVWRRKQLARCKKRAQCKKKSRCSRTDLLPLRMKWSCICSGQQTRQFSVTSLSCFHFYYWYYCCFYTTNHHYHYYHYLHLQLFTSTTAYEYYYRHPAPTTCTCQLHTHRPTTYLLPSTTHHYPPLPTATYYCLLHPTAKPTTTC